MLDTGKDAAPVTAIQSLVNSPADLDINLVAFQDSVIDQTQQM